ncbi:MAG: tRNA (adenosine(37)-N6)-threonylcarbamoyltransferase complex ATPase subunit type 1 TsaE [Chloroflexi bacterium]|nr:tRNA (adenosine(37)-N6)-threonylcarbamoyltransferase complex ATPase subunit type 1 TsaE [Chloroflexota bacterium]
MASLTLNTNNPEETQALGRRIGELMQAGDLLLLRGTMGAGKTTLTQGIAWGAGVTGYAHSPTFVLVNEYAGRFPVFHLDLYRFEGGDAVDDLGEVEDLAIDEMLEQGACVVEWGERASGVFPEGHLSILITPGEADEARIIELAPHGSRYEEIVREIEWAAAEHG